MKPDAAAKAVLDAINYVTIATICEDGSPWNTAVAAFHFDGDYSLYWTSWQGNRHSQNIQANGKAFVVVYDSTPSNNQPSAGVYVQGRAAELTDEQEVMQAALVFKDDPYNPPDGEQYLGIYPRRMYKFVPEKIWMNSDDTIDGKFIDVRVSAEA